MTKYITSRMAANVNYAVYTKAANGLNKVQQIITIKGGADVADKMTLVTPEGIVTPISDDEFDKLQDSPVFRRHVERGMIKVSANERNAEKSSPELTKDASAQLTPKDYKKHGKRKPKTAKENND